MKNDEEFNHPVLHYCNTEMNLFMGMLNVKSIWGKTRRKTSRKKVETKELGIRYFPMYNRRKYKALNNDGIAMSKKNGKERKRNWKKRQKMEKKRLSAQNIRL